MQGQRLSVLLRCESFRVKICTATTKTLCVVILLIDDKLLDVFKDQLGKILSVGLNKHLYFFFLPIVHFDLM